MQGSLEGARRVFTMACLVEAQHTPHTRRRHAHAHTNTRAQHMLKVVEASRRVAASLTAAALPSQYFIWHLNQILLVFCCHSRRRLPRTPTEAATATASELATASTTTTTATLILPRLDTQTVHEYLSTCSQTLFSAHTHTLAQTRSVIDLCLYLANLAGESPAVNPGDASTRRMRNIRPGKHDTSCANNASARAKQSERGREMAVNNQQRNNKTFRSSFLVAFLLRPPSPLPPRRVESV